MAAPWLAMFAVLPQMHERYLVWGAAITALAAAVSLGATLLHVLISCIACVPIAELIILAGNLQDDYPAWDRFLERACDRLSWVTVLIAVIWIYLSLAGSRRSETGRAEAKAATGFK